MIKAVKFVSIPVKDQNRALEFYTQKLGFQVLTDQPMGQGQRWLELKIPGGETKVVLFTPTGHETRIGTFSNITFMSDNVEKTYEELSALGVEFPSPPAEKFYGIEAVFQDPSGNRFSLTQRK